MIKIIFISQPRNCKTEEELMKREASIINWLNITRGEKHYTNYTMRPYPNHGADINEPNIGSSTMEQLWNFGCAVHRMSLADLIVFSEDWESDRQCRIEHKIAEEYNIEYIDLPNDWDSMKLSM